MQDFNLQCVCAEGVALSYHLPLKHVRVPLKDACVEIESYA